MSFQPIQNFDGLSPQTTKGDLISRSTTTAVRVAVGSDGQALLADSTQASGVKWGAASSNWNYTSKTSTYNPAAINDYILCSSSSFTITLPTAVGNGGKSIGIQHGGTSLTQVYTLQTTSSQTIAGVAGGSYALYTNGEVVIVTSNDANWLVTGRCTHAIGAETPTIGATTTPPTTADGIVAFGQQWSRDGKYADIKFQLVQSNTTNANNGSGDYKFPLPTGMTIGTPSPEYFTTVVGATNDAIISNCVGTGTWHVATSSYSIQVVAYDSSNVRAYYLGVTTGGMVCSTTGAGLATASFALCFNYRVPISGWQP